MADEKKKMGITGECMPFPIDMLKGLKEIEGYVVLEESSAAVFKSKIKDGGIQIPQHIQKAFEEGEEILTIAFQSRRKKESGG